TNRGFPDYYDALARQPDVADVGVGVGVEAFVTGAKAPPGTPGSSSLGAGFQLLVAADTHMGVRIDKPKVAEGRMFRPDRPDEIVADRNLADAFHLHAGSVLHAIVAPTTASGVDASKGRPVTFKVVGVIATRDDVVPATALPSSPRSALCSSSDRSSPGNCSSRPATTRRWLRWAWAAASCLLLAWWKQPSWQPSEPWSQSPSPSPPRPTCRSGLPASPNLIPG